MEYNLEIINARALGDPGEFARECETAYERRVEEAARVAAERLAQSPIVLLSGPSGSGKTTTAKKICEKLEAMGIRAHSISMDDYFLTLDPETAPRTETNELDRESPHCLDMKLLSEHFGMLARGEEVFVPRFNFKKQARAETSTPLRLGGDEVAVFEGIHALNDIITTRHPQATRLYVSARSDVTDGGAVCFKGTWTRLLRRIVRDARFRGTETSETLKMWANVRHGEKKHISPYKHTAHFILNTSLEYEITVIKSFAESAFNHIPRDAGRFDELCEILPALARFADMDEQYIPPESMLREFIGGGIYEY